MQGGLLCITHLSWSLSCKELFCFGRTLCSCFSFDGEGSWLIYAFDADFYREKVMEVVEKAMKNPRSALCKTSIMAASDIFKAFGDKLLDSTNSAAFDNMVNFPF